MLLSNYDTVVSKVTPNDLMDCYLDVTDGTGSVLRIYLMGEMFGITDCDLFHSLHNNANISGDVKTLNQKASDPYGIFTSMLDLFEMVRDQNGTLFNEFAFGLLGVVYAAYMDDIKPDLGQHLSVKLVTPYGTSDLMIPQEIDGVSAEAFMTGVRSYLTNPNVMFEASCQQGAYSDMSEDDIQVLAESYNVSGQYFGNEMQCSVFAVTVAIMMNLNRTIAAKNAFIQKAVEGSCWTIR